MKPPRWFPALWGLAVWFCTGGRGLARPPPPQWRWAARLCVNYLAAEAADAACAGASAFLPWCFSPFVCFLSCAGMEALSAEADAGVAGLVAAGAWANDATATVDRRAAMRTDFFMEIPDSARPARTPGPSSRPGIRRTCCDNAACAAQVYAPAILAVKWAATSLHRQDHPPTCSLIRFPAGRHDGRIGGSVQASGHRGFGAPGERCPPREYVPCSSAIGRRMPP